MTDVAQTVVGILAAQALLDPAEIAPDATIDSIGLDSLGLVEAIFAIEEAFDIHVPFNPQDAQATGSGQGGAGFDTSSVASIIDAVQVLIARRAG